MHMDENGQARAVIWVHGRVQGCGFRWWTRARALELGLVGHARNTNDGRVEVMAQGPRERLEELVALLEQKPSDHLRPGDVSSCVTTWGAPRDGVQGFVEK